MDHNSYKHFNVEDFKLKWNGDIEPLRYFIVNELNLSGKWSSPGGEVKLFTNEDEVSSEGEIVKIKWYQSKKTLLFEGSKAKQIERDIYSIKQSNTSFKEGETCSRFDTSNLHNNDKFVEAINDFRLEIQQLKGIMEQNKTAIANLETVCKSSSNDTAYIELHTLRTYLLRKCDSYERKRRILRTHEQLSLYCL